MNVSPKCAVEVLEVIKYLDDELKSNISQEFIDYFTQLEFESP